MIRDEEIQSAQARKRPFSAMAASAAAAGRAQAAADSDALMSKPVPEGEPPASTARPARDPLQPWSTAEAKPGSTWEPWSKENRAVGQPWAPENRERDGFTKQYGAAEDAKRQQAVAPATNPNMLPAGAARDPDERGF